MKKLLLITVLLLSYCVKSQPPQNNEDIKAIFDIYFDNKKIESDSVFIGITQYDVEPTLYRLNDSFTTFLKVNKYYKVVIIHYKYQKKVFTVHTTENAPLLFKINFNNKKPEDNLGCVKYNNKYGKYVFIKS